VKSGQTNIRANFIGEWLSDEQLASFRTFIKENKLEDIVSIHGKINDRSKIKAMLYESNVFVLPTYFAQEAQPLSIIEALNAGVPVISTSHASIPEYISDGVNGYLVSKQAPQEIADALLKLMNVESWKKMASNARHSFNGQFSLEVYKQKLFELLN
jgi:glycosyltransferase involved in cell wall biosynthesis